MRSLSASGPVPRHVVATVRSCPPAISHQLIDPTCATGVLLGDLRQGGFFKEFSSGGKLYVGGVEAATRARLSNELGVSLVVDCRGDENQGRHRSTHVLPPLPPGVRNIFLPSKQFGGYFNVKRVPAVFQPIIEALRRGETVLVHCVNGRHRSTQGCTAVISPFFFDVDSAWNLVWSLRHLAEFSCLSGSAGSVGPRRTELAPDRVSP